MIRAARYLGVAPWDLTERSVLWQQAALMAQAAENEAEEALAQQAQPAQ